MALRSDELMVGDWVSSDDGNAIIIPPIAEDGVFLKDEAGICAASYDRINPIPLTAEILEKNGFEVQDQGGGRKDVWTGFGIDCEGDIEVEFQHNTPTHLKIDGVSEGEYYTSTNIKYVHQLQHALRLCGIEKEIELC